MKKYCVYMHIFPNDKKYIGMTCKHPNKRWQNGNGYDNHQPVMKNAIHKYGWSNVNHVILKEGLSHKEACDLEMFYISQYKTNCKRYGDAYGYNMTDGGDGATGHVVSDDAKLKMSKVKKGKTGKNCPNSKVVVCDSVEYNSLTEFKNINHPKGAIYQWLNGTKAMPKYWYDKKLHYKDSDFSIIKCQAKSWSNKIMYNGIVFNSQAELARHLKIQPSLLCRWIKTNSIPSKYKDKIKFI